MFGSSFCNEDSTSIAVALKVCLTAEGTGDCPVLSSTRVPCGFEFSLSVMSVALFREEALGKRVTLQLLRCKYLLIYLFFSIYTALLSETQSASI